MIDYDKLFNWKIPEVEQTFMRRDTILYALSIGVGNDPTDLDQLRFVYEKDLQALPTMGTVLGYPINWLRTPGTGVDHLKVVNVGHKITIHKTLPVEGNFVGVSRVASIIDKGPGKGALVHWERKVYDKKNGDLLCTLVSANLCRGDGGFGGPTGPVRPLHQLPEMPPEETCSFPTLHQASLLYRLNGDVNPLHADPQVAQAAGFKRPILHGLCSFGVAGYSILKNCCQYDPGRLRGMEGRFSGLVYPGETIRTDIWRDGSIVSFRSVVLERNTVAIDNGRAEIMP
ncbi:MAG: MaoC/PaaZ C-terminal domain-containing protein [Haliea sp.]